MKLKDALVAFLSVDRSDETHRTYERFFTRFVSAIGPERSLDLITEADIGEFIHNMRHQKTKYEGHERRPVVEEPLSPATIYKNIKMIKSFFKWCVKKEYLEKSPAEEVSNRRPTRPLGQGKAATDKEVSKLLEAARFKPRDFAIVQLLAQSGCRAGEAASLKIRDLDLENNEAYVDGKGDIRRVIYFDPGTTEILRAWLAVRPRANHDFVFTSVRDNHAPLSPWAVSNIIRRLCRTAGLNRELGAHSLRHRVGVTFARKRVSPRVTQAYLGHTNIKTTLEYYQDVDESDLKSAGNLLSSNLTEWQEQKNKNPAT